MGIKVGLFGFGRTGRAVASIMLKSSETWLEWVARKSTKLEHRSVPEFLGIESPEPGTIFSVNNLKLEHFFAKNPVEIIVDFSSESGIDYYGEIAAQRGIGIVSAVSQYANDKIEILKKLSKRIPVLWSPNITLGINFLILASRVLKKINPGIDIEILEEHFREKREVSGTAKKIATALDVPFDTIKSIRAGGIIGRHEVIFGFPFQTVRIIHESISREAFGNGAIFAVKNLAGKPPGLYTMEDLLLPHFLGLYEKK